MVFPSKFSLCERHGHTHTHDNPIIASSRSHTAIYCSIWSRSTRWSYSYRVRRAFICLCDFDVGDDSFHASRRRDNSGVVGIRSSRRYILHVLHGWDVCRYHSLVLHQQTLPQVLNWSTYGRLDAKIYFRQTFLHYGYENTPRALKFPPKWP